MSEATMDWNPEYNTQLYDLQPINISKMIPEPPKSPDWEKFVENLDRDLVKQRALATKTMVNNFCKPGTSRQSDIDVAGNVNRTGYEDTDSTIAEPVAETSKRADTVVIGHDKPNTLDRWNDPAQSKKAIDNNYKRLTPATDGKTYIQ